MKSAILATALTSIFALNAARAQDKQGILDKHQIDVVWNGAHGYYNPLTNIGLEYTYKPAHLTFGAQIHYNRGGGTGLMLGTDAFDFREKHGFAIRPSVGIVITNDIKENWLNDSLGVKTVRGFTLYTRDTPEKAGTVSVYSGYPMMNTAKTRTLGSIVLGTDVVLGRPQWILNGVAGFRYEIGAKTSKLNLSGGLRIDINKALKAVVKSKR